MTTNRFLSFAQYLDNPRHSRFRAGYVPRYGRAQERCPQVTEAPVGSDQFVLDVLQFFFQERLQPSQLNDDLRQVAAEAVWRANQGSSRVDLIPRPPGGMPNVTWLVSQAVQIAFRRAQNQCIYEMVRVTVQGALRPAYVQAKAMSETKSFYARPFTNNFTLSQNGIDFIKQHESFRSSLYNDPAGHCTIGYGHLVHRGNCNGSESEEFRNGITEQRATELMMQEVRRVEGVVNNSVTVDLNQHQFDALVSFAYNVGTGAFGNSTLLRLLNQGNFSSVSTELRRWIHANGRVLAGLQRRREEEVNIFESGRYSAGQSHYARQYDSVMERYASGLSAGDRVLVILIENGGIDLDVGGFVDQLISWLIPVSRLVPDSFRQEAVNYINRQFRQITDTLLESADLAFNHFNSAVPAKYREVIVLRNGTATYNELKNTLIRQTNDNRLIDLFILTHGGTNSICSYGGSSITDTMIRNIKTENNNRPIRLRAVYMMNCIGSSLNDDWLAIGAKTSVGSVRNNYLPEPTLHYFWNNWKSGQSFSDSATNAYQQTITTIRTIIRNIPGIGSFLDDLVDLENQEFIQDSAPFIQGEGALTITSDNLSFGQTLNRNLAVTVIPVRQAAA